MTTQLVAIGVSRGKRLHLGEAGSRTTLCGLAHRVNPKYVTPARFTMPLDDVDCPQCLKVR